MKLKSYFSSTVEGALEIARAELGDEALVVSARPTTPVTRLLGAYEVVFGVPPGGEAPRPKVASRVAAECLAEDVAGLKREFQRLARSLSHGRAFATPPLGGGSDLYSQLLENEMDPMLARAVAEGRPLADLFETEPGLGRPGAERGVVALVGPPGVGKTTTLVKLAARYGLAARKPAYILTADVQRIAAAEQLRSLAGILGIGFEVLETPLALAQALEEHRSKALIFIDTPGLARNEMDDSADLARLIAAHPEMDTHLALAASMKPADLARVIDDYEIFQPRKLLFTRIDETDRYGALVSEAARRSLPVSFLTTGQQIPDDLEPATKDRLLELALGSLSASLGAGQRSWGATA